MLNVELEQNKEYLDKCQAALAATHAEANAAKQALDKAKAGLEAAKCRVAA